MGDDLPSLRPTGVTRVEVENIVREFVRSGDIVGVRHSVTDDEQQPNHLDTAHHRGRKKMKLLSGPLPPKVRMVSCNNPLFMLKKKDLPSAILNRLHRLAAFQNPEFYRAQAMRLSTFGKPRVIRCAEEFPSACSPCLAVVFGEIAHHGLFESHKVAVEL